MTNPLSSEAPVTDRTGCLRVIRALAEDFGSDGVGWENATIPAYLAAMAAWIEDADLAGKDAPAWRLLADALRAARVYE
jgi:hypothetical protein